MSLKHKTIICSPKWFNVLQHRYFNKLVLPDIYCPNSTWYFFAKKQIYHIESSTGCVSVKIGPIHFPVGAIMLRGTGRRVAPL